MRSYLRYWCEAFRLPTWSAERVNSTFNLERDHLMDAEMASGKGVIMVVNHGGNWDHAGAWACLRYGGLTTVAERLKPEGLFDKFVEYRETLGMEVLPLGDADVMRTLARRLGEGRLLALVGDRDISRNGIEVDFFGEKASMPAGSAALAIMTGAAILPVTLWFEPGRATGYIHDRVHVPDDGDKASKVQRMTQQIADAFEAGLRERSVDWHMMQPVWIADLDPARRTRVAEEA
jgi:KDO2-lipid IV(A) lauroyltransferase